MAAFYFSPRFGVVLFLMAVCARATDINCQLGEPGCEENDRDIGTAYVAPGPWRKLLWTPRNVNSESTLESEDMSTGRSLLGGYCSDTDSSDKAVVECTNAVRTNPDAFEYRCGKSWINSYNRLGDLKWDDKLMLAAQRHAEDNARMGRLSHTGSDGSRVSTRVGRTGYEYGPVSENIAYGHTSAKDVVLGWMCSSGHRDNIMSCNYHEIGVGVARGSNGRLYFAQVFACPKGERCGCGGGGENPSPWQGSTGGDSSSPSEDKPKEDPYYSPKHEDPSGKDYPSPSDKPYGGYGGFFDHPYFKKYEDQYSGGDGGDGYYPVPYSMHSGDGHGGSGGYGSGPYYRSSGGGHGYGHGYDDKGKHKSHTYESDDGRAAVKYSSGPGYVSASVHATSG